eukprot:CAMPEP_0118693672 /NCGR_PEP_ID=MMETSP0800-20121206/12049_1 /TAXON_ID=210618 ORGANISM="Striatella unipunctata, Strain CCMP2910" /NCGR_SAMPLE_ID=MMETSP0800 /ASSEMBLY_ACC=CAM_ASM_000638 /LENGTH=213 /DNA_ID=CAMNT_0006591955 /DNA_START=53 /DNA_END=694 /DNA_ORIENTATION=-
MSTPDFTIDPKETAVVLIEFQNEFTTEGGGLYGAVKDCMETKGTLDNAKKVMDKAREAGCTIIHVPISFEKGHKEITSEPYGILKGVKDGNAFLANEWASAICDKMSPAEPDIIAKGKVGLCGFHSTNLDFLLRSNGAKNVILGGFLTNCCIESTMRSAYERGYKVYTLDDCCAATSVEAHDAAFKHNFGMFSVPTKSDEVIAALEKEAVAVA